MVTKALNAAGIHACRKRLSALLTIVSPQSGVAGTASTQRGHKRLSALLTIVS